MEKQNHYKKCNSLSVLRFTFFLVAYFILVTFEEEKYIYFFLFKHSQYLKVDKHMEMKLKLLENCASCDVFTFLISQKYH